MKMKKILIIALTLLMVVGILAGCTGEKAPSTADPTPPTDESSETPEPDADGVIVNEDGTIENPESVKVDENKLVFWSLFSGGDGTFMDKIIADYNASSPTKEVQSIMLVWGDYYTKLATAVASGNSPDIGVSHVSRLPELVEGGIIQSFEKEAVTTGIDWSKYTDSMNAGVVFNNEHYAIPLDIHAEIMYLNLDLIEKAGVTETEIQSIKSASDFKALLDKVKPVLEDGQTAISLSQKGDDPYRIWWATYFQMGGTPLVNDGATELTLDKEIAKKAAEYVKTYYTDGFVLPGIDDHQKMFQNGQAAFGFGGTWATGAFEQTKDLNFNAIPFPSLFGTNEACWADAHTLTIPANSKRSAEDNEAAVEFINFVSSKGAVTWAESGQIPANIDVQESKEYTELPYRSGYVKAASTAVFPDSTPVFGALKESLIMNLDEFWIDQVDVDTFISNLVSDLETKLN